jgi:hypothetical protein
MEPAFEFLLRFVERLMVALSAAQSGRLNSFLVEMANIVNIMLGFI